MNINCMAAENELMRIGWIVSRESSISCDFVDGCGSTSGEIASVQIIFPKNRNIKFGLHV